MCDYTILYEIGRIFKVKSNHYEVLCVRIDASDEEIKKAYKKLSLKVHPDKNKHPMATEAFKIVGEATSVLTDPDERKRFDQKLAENSKWYNVLIGHLYLQTSKSLIFIKRRPWTFIIAATVLFLTCTLRVTWEEPENAVLSRVLSLLGENRSTGQESPTILRNLVDLYILLRKFRRFRL